MHNPQTTGGHGAALAQRSEDRLLLDEHAHRIGNETAAAIAALRLIKAAKGSKARWRLLDSAIARMEGFAEASRHLATPPRASVDAGAELERLVKALAAERIDGRTQQVEMRLPQLWVDGETARRLLLIATEMLTNALRHGMAGGGTVVLVDLCLDGTDVVLAVSDDGPGSAATGATAGTGLGTGLVEQLAIRGGGLVQRASSPAGYTAAVRLPLDMDAMKRVRSHG